MKQSGDYLPEVWRSLSFWETLRARWTALGCRGFGSGGHYQACPLRKYLVPVHIRDNMARLPFDMYPVLLPLNFVTSGPNLVIMDNKGIQDLSISAHTVLDSKQGRLRIYLKMNKAGYIQPTHVATEILKAYVVSFDSSILDANHLLHHS